MSRISFLVAPDQSRGVRGLRPWRETRQDSIDEARTELPVKRAAAEFHPGSNAHAPGLVVLLSTTPTIAGTPLNGPQTNLAGVFQINDVSRLDGLKRTFNSWLVGVPGFFGQNKQATLTVFAVRGTAPAIIDVMPRPISNIVHETFTISP